MKTLHGTLGGNVKHLECTSEEGIKKYNLKDLTTIKERINNFIAGSKRKRIITEGESGASDMMLNINVSLKSLYEV